MINWHSTSKRDWDSALGKYTTYLTTPAKAALDSFVSMHTAPVINSMTVIDFYDYLYNSFYVWKYTAPNRLKTTRTSLSTHRISLLTPSSTGVPLQIIKDFLCVSTHTDGDLILKAKSIPGLGVAGATALLSTMYPDRFGTIDQFVVNNLQHAFPTNPMILSINKFSIKVNEAIIIEDMLRKKAALLSALFTPDVWTPRMVDKAVWADR